MSTKLHEIIAVDGDREKAAQSVMEEAAVTFSKKHPLFNGAHKKLTMFDEKRKPEEGAAEEFREIETTVRQKLDYVWEHIIKHLDCNAVKESTNTVAKADIIVDGKVLANNVPATLLLSLEGKLKKIREMYNHIPTLLPGIEWVPDEQAGEDIFTNKHAEKANKTEKTVQFLIMVQATDKHPAQVEKWNADVPIGVFETKYWTGMISPAEKSKLLGRIDSLAQAVKQARQRANESPIIDVKIGKILFDFIHA